MSNLQAMDQTDLDQRLAALLAEWSERAFQWGVTDCCQFARAAAWRLHGLAVDAPSYISEREAVRTLCAMGGFSGLLKLAGLQRRASLLSARRGDLVLVSMLLPDGSQRAGLFPQGLALVTGVVAHMPGPVGLESVARSAWVEAWGVV